MTIIAHARARREPISAVSLGSFDYVKSLIQSDNDIVHAGHGSGDCSNLQRANMGKKPEVVSLSLGAGSQINATNIDGTANLKKIGQRCEDALANHGDTSHPCILVGDMYPIM